MILIWSEVSSNKHSGDEEVQSHQHPELELRSFDPLNSLPNS